MGEYKAPFLYATNGRPYLKQLKDESGIWFWDSRKPLEHSRPLEGWHSPMDLQMLLEQDDQDADKKLEEESIEKFSLRPYQQNAVLSVESGLKESKRRMLVAMATGTENSYSDCINVSPYKTKSVVEFYFWLTVNHWGHKQKTL